MVSGVECLELDHIPLPAARGSSFSARAGGWSCPFRLSTLSSPLAKVHMRHGTAAPFGGLCWQGPDPGLQQGGCHGFRARRTSLVDRSPTADHHLTGAVLASLMPGRGVSVHDARADASTPKVGLPTAVKTPSSTRRFAFGRSFRALRAQKIGVGISRFMEHVCATRVGAAACGESLCKPQAFSIALKAPYFSCITRRPARPPSCCLAGSRDGELLASTAIGTALRRDLANVHRP